MVIATRTETKAIDEPMTAFHPSSKAVPATTQVSPELPGLSVLSVLSVLSGSLGLLGLVGDIRAIRVYTG